MFVFFTIVTETVLYYYVLSQTGGYTNSYYYFKTFVFFFLISQFVGLVTCFNIINNYRRNVSITSTLSYFNASVKLYVAHTWNIILISKSKSIYCLRITDLFTVGHTRFLWNVNNIDHPWPAVNFVVSNRDLGSTILCGTIDRKI